MNRQKYVEELKKQSEIFGILLLLEEAPLASELLMTVLRADIKHYYWNNLILQKRLHHEAPSWYMEVCVIWLRVICLLLWKHYMNAE